MTVCLLASCSGNGNNFGEKVKQVSIHRIDSMPDMPETYKMLDWKQKAQKYDQFIFDWNNKSEVGPLIWLDDAAEIWTRLHLAYILPLKIFVREKMPITESSMKV